jgi:hypothetical protein
MGGLIHARNCGKQLGRPPLHELSSKEIEQMKAEKKNDGTSLRGLAEKFGITLWMAYQLCRSEGARV